MKREEAVQRMLDFFKEEKGLQTVGWHPNRIEEVCERSTFTWPWGSDVSTTQIPRALADQVQDAYLPLRKAIRDLSYLGLCHGLGNLDEFYAALDRHGYARPQSGDDCFHVFQQLLRHAQDPWAVKTLDQTETRSKQFGVITAPLTPVFVQARAEMCDLLIADIERNFAAYVERTTFKTNTT